VLVGAGQPAKIRALAGTSTRYKEAHLLRCILGECRIPENSQQRQRGE
jgi:hypothetical protein